MNSRIASNDFEFILCECRALFLKKKIIKKYADSVEPQIQQIIQFLKKNRISVFPYSYTKKYRISDVQIEKDENNGLLYAVLNGRRLYLRRGYQSKYRAARYVKNILLEQDPESPHCYLNADFMPEENSVVIDIGGAEGAFSLPHIDKMKHVFIFDCDASWVEALNATYKDYKDKVTIIKKFVSAHTDDNHICLDDLVKQYHLENEKIFIKIDAEGDEINILKGAKELLREVENVKLAVCVYHRQEHERKIREHFKGWRITNSEGYMIYYYDFDCKDPYLRRGVLRIEKTP